MLLKTLEINKRFLWIFLTFMHLGFGDKSGLLYFRFNLFSCLSVLNYKGFHLKDKFNRFDNKQQGRDTYFSYKTIFTLWILFFLSHLTSSPKCHLFYYEILRGKNIHVEWFQWNSLLKRAKSITFESNCREFIILMWLLSR